MALLCILLAKASHLAELKSRGRERPSACSLGRAVKSHRKGLKWEAVCKVEAVI